MAKSAKLGAIVKARSEIQLLLYDLHEYLLKRQEHLANNDRDLYCQAFTIIMGAAFSLWRAAFLTQDERHRDTIIEHAQSFLMYLVRDNAIAYPQDRDTQAWSSTYYMNSANMRLVLLADVLPSIVRSGGFDLDERRRSYQKAILAGTSWDIDRRKPSENLWVESFAELKRLFDAFKVEFDGECERRLARLQSTTQQLATSPAAGLPRKRPRK